MPKVVWQVSSSQLFLERAIALIFSTFFLICGAYWVVSKYSSLAGADFSLGDFITLFCILILYVFAITILISRRVHIIYLDSVKIIGVFGRSDNIGLGEIERIYAIIGAIYIVTLSTNKKLLLWNHLGGASTLHSLLEDKKV